MNPGRNGDYHLAPVREDMEDTSVSTYTLPNQHREDREALSLLGRADNTSYSSPHNLR